MQQYTTNHFADLTLSLRIMNKNVRKKGTLQMFLQSRLIGFLTLKDLNNPSWYQTSTAVYCIRFLII